MSEKDKENKVNQEEIPDEEMENEEGQDGQDDGGQGEGRGEAADDEGPLHGFLRDDVGGGQVRADG